MKIFGIVGWKNSGKTTLICRLIEHFSAQGLKVSSLKHTHHRIPLDEKGKDSYKHSEAGACEVMLVSGNQWALFNKEAQDEPPLEHLLSRFAEVDILLIEGFKQHPHPKIQVYRQASGAEVLNAQIPELIAIASDDKGRNSTAVQDSKLRIMDLNDVESIASFILTHSAESPEQDS